MDGHQAAARDGKAARMAGKGPNGSGKRPKDYLNSSIKFQLSKYVIILTFGQNRNRDDA